MAEDHRLSNADYAIEVGERHKLIILRAALHIELYNVMSVVVCVCVGVCVGVWVCVCVGRGGMGMKVYV